MDNRQISAGNRTSISQNVGNNTGQVSAAGGDINATQNITQAASSESLNKEEAIALLTEIEKLIRAANLPPEVQEEAQDYTRMTRREVGKETPQPSRLQSHLEGLTSVLQTAGKGATSLKPILELVAKFKQWFG